MTEAPKRPANARVIAKFPGRNRIRGTKTAQEHHDHAMRRGAEPLHLAKHGLTPHHKN